MMVRPALLALMCAWSFSGAAIAAPQDASAPDTFKANGLGLGVSWLSGSGLTYRHWFNRDWGVQVAGVPFVATNASGQPSGFVNVGAQAMRTFVTAGPVDLYGLLGVGLGYSFGDQSGSAFGIAPGVGIDYQFLNNFVLTGAVGYTVGQNTGSTPFSYSTSGTQLTLSPGASIGVLFIW